MPGTWVRSLSLQLWVASMVALAISLTLIVSLVLGAFYYFPDKMWQEDENSQLAHRIAEGIRYDVNGTPVSLDLEPRIDWLLKVAPEEVMYRIFDQQGQLLLFSTDGAAMSDRHPWGRQGLALLADSQQKISINGEEYSLLTRKIEHNGHFFYQQLATNTLFNRAMMDTKLRPIPHVIGWTLFIASIVFAILFPLIFRFLLRPLRIASRAAASITPANLQTRLAIDDVPSEIKPLMAAFNDALSRLEKGFKVQQEFLASVAHELQTPLTLLRGQIELQTDIREPGLMFREIDLMARQVRQLLHLAEVSEQQNYTFGDVDRDEVAADVIDYLQPKARGRQVTLLLQTAVDLPLIRADKGALFILLKNLIENAIHVTPADHAVKVIIEAAAIRVVDNGPGIPAENLPLLFTRFWRGAETVSEGAGLGLAICKEIATAHRWLITVETSGQGTHFVLWL